MLLITLKHNFNSHFLIYYYLSAPSVGGGDIIVTSQQVKDNYVQSSNQYNTNFTPDNVDIARHPVHMG